jgi:hypothetical protein
MRRRLHAILGILFVLALAYDFYLWGGLSKTPTLGRLVTDVTSRELALATVYVPAGGTLLDLSGQGAAAARHAQAVFAPLEAHLAANPQAAMETLVVEMPWLAKVAYHGAPLLLMAFALAWWRRPRMVHSLRRR